MYKWQCFHEKNKPTDPLSNCWMRHMVSVTHCLGFPVTITPPILHPHELIYYKCYIILASDNKCWIKHVSLKTPQDVHKTHLCLETSQDVHKTLSLSQHKMYIKHVSVSKLHQTYMKHVCLKTPKDVHNAAFSNRTDHQLGGIMSCKFYSISDE